MAAAGAAHATEFVMSSKKAAPTKSVLKVNDYTLVQFDEDALRAIIREEIALFASFNVNNHNATNDNLKRIESKIDKLVWFIS